MFLVAEMRVYVEQKLNDRGNNSTDAQLCTSGRDDLILRMRCDAGKNSFFGKPARDLMTTLTPLKTEKSPPYTSLRYMSTFMRIMY